MPTDTSTAAGPFAPFRHRIFLALWIASLASNFGSLIQGVGASWMMMSMEASPTMVALVQASTSLPIMLFSLLAGAVADVWDRRRLMLLAQLLMLAVSAGLAALAWLDRVTPELLLACTFLLGCGAALYGPAWQSSVGEQVPREDLAGAVALNSLGFNLARSVGPALGGLIVAAAGPEAAFVLNAISYFGLIAVLIGWKRTEPPRLLPREALGAAVSAGLRYARLSPRIAVVLFRSFVFGLLAGAVWALLPLVVRDRLGGGALSYGLLLGAFGLGAVGGALLGPRVRSALSNEAIVALGSLVFGVASIATGLSIALIVTLPVLAAAGAAWVLTLSTLNVIIQLGSPRWVLGRTLAVYQTATFGGLALGSWLWGLAAETQGLQAGLVASGLLLAASALLGLRLPLPSAEALDLAPAGRGAPRTGLELQPRSGPVVTTIGYRVALEDVPAFAAAMRVLCDERRRNGARHWALMRDIADPEVWTERFDSPTWLEMLRRRERFTQADEAVQARVYAFHREEGRPPVRHWLERPPGALSALENEQPPSPVRAGGTDPLLPAPAQEPRG